jgi:hypothetical protein
VDQIAIPRLFWPSQAAFPRGRTAAENATIEPRTHETDRPGYVVDGDRDVVAGGEAPRPLRAVLVCTAVAALLAAEPIWHAVAPRASPPRGAASPAAQPATPSPPTDSAPSPELPLQSVLRPHARGSDLALLRWYAALPRAAPPASQTSALSSVFRVRHSAGFAGAADFGAAAQVRGTQGWTDVAHGDIGAGRLDATGRRVAFTVRAPRLTEYRTRTWAFVVSVADASVRTTTGLPEDALLLGWFGDRLVIDQSEIGRPPVLIDGTGRETPRELGVGSSAVADGDGDVQFVGPDLVHCLTGWRLGLVPRTGVGVCPDDALVALSPDGRWGVTRDLHWLNQATGRSTPMTRPPPRWPVESVDFADDRRARVVVRLPGRPLGVLCSLRAGCARLR